MKMTATQRAVTLSLLRRIVADGTAQRIRVEAGLSLGDVGRAIGTDAATIWHWEHGRQPRARLALAYAELIGELASSVQVAR